MGDFYIVATPIGNLSDITFRAIDVLKSVDLILCEDTRKTKILLDRYQIKVPTSSYHQHSKLKKIDYILNLLEQKKNIALVSDAGTPGVSDPGNFLVKEIFLKFGKEVKVIPIPGASAAISALSISGFATDKFIFLGFAPVKNKRKKFFEEIVSSKYPVVFYESPYRIIKTLSELREMNGDLSIIVCREMTKKFETIYRGKVGDVIEQLKGDKILGEFVVIAEEKKQI
jgi:16S rRNA (cytidine1402-2'-O)-methyltransferase